MIPTIIVHLYLVGSPQYAIPNPIRDAMLKGIYIDFS